MSRRPKSENGVSLFPFLAVLMSAMGALNLLLLVVTRQAQRQHAAEQAALVAEAKEEHARAVARRRARPLPALPPLPMREWEPSMPPLPSLPERVELPPLPTLPEYRPPLVRHHVLPELPSLRDERPGLRAQHQQLHEELAALGARRQAHPRPDRERLADLDDELALLRQRLEELHTYLSAQQERLQSAKMGASRLLDERNQARAKALRESNQFAVVPYWGPNGTAQRPIYLECRADAIILQPEGVAIGPHLLRQPRDPDNALANLVAALVQDLRSGATNATPYPLLLVRPEGIAAFYLARQALEHTGLPFGYELLPAEVELSFPPRDERLANLARAATKPKPPGASMATVFGNGPEDGRGVPSVSSARLGENGLGGLPRDTSGGDARGGLANARSLAERGAGERGAGERGIANAGGLGNSPESRKSPDFQNAPNGIRPGYAGTGSAPGHDDHGDSPAPGVSQGRGSRPGSNTSSASAGSAGGAQGNSPEYFAEMAGLGPARRQRLNALGGYDDSPPSSLAEAEEQAARRISSLQDPWSRMGHSPGRMGQTSAGLSTGQRPLPGPEIQPPATELAHSSRNGYSSGRPLTSQSAEDRGNERQDGAEDRDGGQEGRLEHRQVGTSHSRYNENADSSVGQSGQAGQSGYSAQLEYSRNSRLAQSEAAHPRREPNPARPQGKIFSIAPPEALEDHDYNDNRKTSKDTRLLTFDDLLMERQQRAPSSWSARDEVGAERSALAQALAPPGAQRWTIPVRREIYLECFADGLRLYPGGVEVPWTDDRGTRLALRAIYRHVLQQVEDWGSPKRGTRWEPALRVIVQPGGLDNCYRLRFAIPSNQLPLEYDLLHNGSPADWQTWR